MARAPQDKGGSPGADLSGSIAAGIRPSEAQRRYLERGLTQAGGKLPLFDRDGREVSRKTIESCVPPVWAPLGVPTPTKRAWLVSPLPPAGYRVLGGEPPAEGATAPGAERA